MLQTLPAQRALAPAIITIAVRLELPALAPVAVLSTCLAQVAVPWHVRAPSRRCGSTAGGAAGWRCAWAPMPRGARTPGTTSWRRRSTACPSGAAAGTARRPLLQVRVRPSLDASPCSARLAKAPPPSAQMRTSCKPLVCVCGKQNKCNRGPRFNGFIPAFRLKCK